MNNYEEQFKEIVAGLNIDDRPNTEHKETLRQQMLATCRGSSSNPPRRIQPVWSKIMKSNITKFAVAAILLIAVFTGIYQITGSIDGAAVAWADVVQQLKIHEKYKCRQRVVRKEGPQIPAMDVYYLNLSLRRQEVEDGSIHIIDMRGKDAITVELYPHQKKAIVTKLLGFGPRKDPDIVDMVKQFEQESTERLGTKKKDGKVLQGFRHQPNEYNDFTVWVDPTTKLPVEIELKHFRDGQLTQTIFMDEFEFDFNLDPSAFSTEIPQGYTVETRIQDDRTTAPTRNQDDRTTEPTVITPEEIRKELNHTAYRVKELPWMSQVCTIKNTDPLGSKTIVYMTGIHTSDGNVIVMVQGNYYDMTRMVWIPRQDLVFETPEGIKLYTHPNGSLYAQYFLESFTKAVPEFEYMSLGEERVTRMVVMPEGVVLSLSAYKEMSKGQLQELIESLVKIE